eukprot:72348-Prorocentrum_minimum.AAC.1
MAAMRALCARLTRASFTSPATYVTTTARTIAAPASAAPKRDVSSNPTLRGGLGLGGGGSTTPSESAVESRVTCREGTYEGKASRQTRSVRNVRSSRKTR